MQVKEVIIKKSFRKILKNLITTFFITLTLAYTNYGESNNFIFLWMRSWVIAALISNLFSIFIFSNKN
ncbi:DUF2798 domain-containing protein [Flavobacterium sp. DG2-3]|uniref:DUF2798 domain-containing protein n=1 Tax=Flavobacterium sp. DG2-3 TaxID=3068317 RepID=UPI003530EB1B